MVSTRVHANKSFRSKRTLGAQAGQRPAGAAPAAGARVGAPPGDGVRY